MTVGRAVARLRKRDGLSRSALATRSRMDYQALAAVEAGQACPTWEGCRRLGAALGFSFDDVFRAATPDGPLNTGSSPGAKT